MKDKRERVSEADNKREQKKWKEIGMEGVKKKTLERREEGLSNKGQKVKNRAEHYFRPGRGGGGGGGSGGLGVLLDDRLDWKCKTLHIFYRSVLVCAILFCYDLFRLQHHRQQH